MPAQYAYYGPGEQHGAYLLHRAGGKIVRVTYTADQRGFRPKFRSFSSSAELDAFLEQHSVPSALKGGNTSLHTIGGIPAIAPIQDNSLNDALPAADEGSSRLTTPIGDHSAAPTLHILSPTTPVDNDTSPPTASSTTTTTTVPQQQGTTTTPPAEDSAAITKAPQEPITTLTLPEDDTSTILPKEPTSVTTLTPGLDNTTTTASPGDNSFTITTPLPADTTIITSPTNTASTTEAIDDMQPTEKDLTSYQDITTSQTEAITSSEDTIIMTTPPGDTAVIAITESDTTTVAPSGSALAISEGFEGNVVITLDPDATPNTTNASTLVPNVTSFFSGDATDNNIQTTPNDTNTFNPAPQGNTLDDITLTTTPDTAFTDPLNDITSLTSSEETTTILDTPTPTHTTTTSLDDSSEHNTTTTTMILPDTTYPATSVTDDITITPSTFGDNITVTTDNPSSPTLSTNANTDAVAITINGVTTISSSTDPSTPRDNTPSENIDTFGFTDTTTMISDILVTNPVTEATIMSIDTTTTTETDDTTMTENDI
ncbi:hypothetical protein E2C01_046805 [Portunus trituberculatus]|uniref:Uncharacterized protein n=1 Tax=Portunus trituberculatus TaxID=210409 RepID=A0A5B7G8R7_PORTR|nr:hypothetical protein [Portunus trituberculatus]